jgi:YrbI family 3-deoxy-D-manno-octulosonate 8-phosphate phosphatase
MKVINQEITPPTPHLPHFSRIHTVVLDFDGVFTDNKVYVDYDGRELVRCDRADGLAIDIIRFYQRKGILQTRFFILSTEKNKVVASRAQKLGLDCHQAVSNKLAFLQSYFVQNRDGDADPLSGCIYLGNDINDLPVIDRVGYSVVPNDAHPLVKAAASKILPQNGGEGFVRGFVEAFLGITNLTRSELNELISDS